ncbi:MAG: methylenetetrahydrofolate reductase, partial [Pseudomonadota bacterium]
FTRLKSFAKLCGASVPSWLEHRFDGLDDDAATRQLIAASTAIEQVQALRAEGVSQFHFYTLNRSELTFAICHDLGIRPPARIAS